MALVLKNPHASAGDIRDVVSILGWEDPLVEAMATHYNILAWRIALPEKADGLHHGIAKSWTRLKRLSMHT